MTAVTDSPKGASRTHTHPADSSRTLLTLLRLADPGLDSDNFGNTAKVAGHEVLRRLLASLQARDQATMLHSRRVALLAVGMGQQLGWEGRHLRVLEVASLLHDFGKFGIPDHVLMKPGPLTAEEADLFARYGDIATDLLQACRLHPEIIETVKRSRLPVLTTSDEQRIGEKAHLGARILAVADAYDSLTNPQPFRDARSHQDAINVLKEATGVRFDGNVVAALARWVNADGLACITAQADVAFALRNDLSLQISQQETQQLAEVFSYLAQLETLYDGFYILDSDLRLVVWSPGIERLLGRTCCEVLGQQLPIGEGWYDPAISQNSAQLLPWQHVLKTRRATAATGVKVQHSLGTWVDVEVHSIPLIDDAGKLQGVAEIFRESGGRNRGSSQYRELKLAASRDPLTGVSNRGELEAQLSRLMEESTGNEEEPLSVIFLDLDHFKAVNDTFGHGTGDSVLIDVADLLRRETYSGELIARYGGEEFVILCPSTDLKQAASRADRLRHAVQSSRIGNEDSLKVTASFGVAQSEAKDNPDQLLGRADRALYMAKEGGRNRVCVLTSEQIEAEEMKNTLDPGIERSEYRAVAKFAACLSSNMAVYKLSGFVEDQRARLRKVSPELITMTLGEPTLLGRWGKVPDKQPVELRIEIGGDVTANPRAATRRVEVTVVVEPRGKRPDVATFQYRARKLLEKLRCYLLAD